MTDLENRIIQSKYGNPGDTEWMFGAGYEMNISVPTQVTMLRSVEGNEYIPVSDPKETKTELKRTVLKRARLSDLISFIEKAIEYNHEFTIVSITDGRSGDNARVPLSGSDMLYLSREIKKMGLRYGDH